MSIQDQRCWDSDQACLPHVQSWAAPLCSVSTEYFLEGQESSGSEHASLDVLERLTEFRHTAGVHKKMSYFSRMLFPFLFFFLHYF